MCAHYFYTEHVKDLWIIWKQQYVTWLLDTEWCFLSSGYPHAPPGASLDPEIVGDEFLDKYM